MKMPKPTDAEKDAFRALVPDHPSVEVKPMFGNLGAFVNGNMFAGLFGSDLGVKLADDDRRALEAVAGSGPYGPPERPMGGYLSVPASWVDEPAVAAPWITKALGHVGTLPPKARKPPSKKR